MTGLIPTNQPSRQQLLSQVRREIADRLSLTLHQAVLDELGPSTQSSFDETEVEAEAEEPVTRQYPWDIDVKIGNQPSFSLPHHANILQLFKRLQGKMLILGGVGSGKTTTLLMLAQKLANRALKEPERPIPILLNLASWDSELEAIEPWLLQQLQIKYQIPHRVTQAWLEKQQLILLLDSLDELSSLQHEDCLKAINQLLISANPVQNLVVTCGFNAYKKCQTRLKLNAALLLRPLPNEYIKNYLFQARSRELWYFLQHEESLLQLAQAPLLLTMMTLAYEEILIESWRRLPNLIKQRDYLLTAYIRRQIFKPMRSKYYPENKYPPPEKVRAWLTWLAQRMATERLDEFKISQIQPSWLFSEFRVRQYQTKVKIFSGFVWALFLGLIAGFIGGIIGQPIPVLILVIVGGVVCGIFCQISWVGKLVLRFMLWSNGDMPWNYRRFLNYATERLLLQKADDRYSFTHKLLQEHFTQM